ncbi:hypothetical protein AA313_de0201161 [Arthrobotrys entomopaga]|nr:hypothetical protein AA313_de0201161 [Arthrobotrys entomopaga]
MSDDFDDLDNELLGLGDEGDQSDNDRRKHMDDSGDESEGAISDSTLGSQQTNNKKKPTIVATSPSPPPARRQGGAADSEDEDDVAGRKDGGVGRKRPSPGDDASSPPKKRAKPAAAKKTKRRKGDSDDEEIDSDDSEDYSAGIASEPISSDDDDGDYPGGSSNELRPIYGYMEHYKDAADKAYLDSLPELEREGVLAERAEEVSKWKEAKEMRDRMRRQKQEAERKKKKDEAHLGARRSTRGESSAKKTAESKKKSQLSELVKRRDEKSARKAGVDASDRSRKKRRNASSDRSEGEEDSESDHDRGSQPVWTTHEKSSSKKVSEEASLADLKLLIVGRSTIAKFWAHPGFEDATVGCFARVCIGNHPETGKSVYRLCQIKGWQDSRHIYEVTGGDRTIKFRRNAIIASADAERPTRVDVFSDTAPNEDEFRWWCAAMDAAKLKRPTVDFVERKRQETKNVTQRRLTTEDFEAMRLKRTSYHPDDPILPMLDIPGLKKRRQQLVDQGDEPEILKIDRELEWRAPPKSLTANLGKPTQLDILGQINKRNREINRQDIRKAQIEEKKRNEIAARMAAENGDSSFMDPFARVKTHAKIYHDNPSTKKKEEKDKEGDVDMRNPSGGEEPNKDNSGPGLGKTDNKVPQVKAGKAKGIDAVIAGLDLQFDIDFDT